MNALLILLFIFLGITILLIFYKIKYIYLTKKLSNLIDVVSAGFLFIITIFLFISLTKGSLNFALLILWLIFLFYVGFAIISNEEFIDDKKQNKDPHKKAKNKD